MGRVVNLRKYLQVKRELLLYAPRAQNCNDSRAKGLRQDKPV